MKSNNDDYASLIIGLGRRGKLHAQALNQYQSQTLTPVAAYDQRKCNSARSREPQDIIVLDTLPSLDAYTTCKLVVIATPPVSHYGYAIRYIDSSKILLLEKPSVSSYKELMGLAELATHSRARLFIGYSERVNPFAQSARRRVQELISQRVVSRLMLGRSRPLLPGPRRDVGRELAVHDLDFVLNDLFPQEHVLFQKTAQPSRLVLDTYFADAGVSVSITSEWVKLGTGKTETMVELKTGEIEHIVTPTGDQTSRLSALRAQLDRILLDNQEDNVDLTREQRVLKALYVD